MKEINMDILIKNGRIIFPDEGTEQNCNIGISNGRIVFIGEGEGPARKVLDAEGLVVSPGFIDIHMHNEEMQDPFTVQRSLLLQGVTMALAGNCGTGLFIEEYTSMFDIPYVNLAVLTGHTHLREAVGITDVYREATENEIRKMCELLERELNRGSFGLSFGLEYAPNTSIKEIRSLSKVLKKFDHRLISVHIRHDGPGCIDAVKEMIDLAGDISVRVQLSHIGSMTAFGESGKALGIIDRARSEGIDIRFDTYPYEAFCTYIGSTVFDPGFEKRWNKGFDALEVASGPEKGRFLDEDLYNHLRSEAPETLIVAHVMNEEEIRACLRHPLAALGSDAILQDKGGHPRAAGAFPRGIRWLREDGSSWPQALSHATNIPADDMWLGSGRIAPGAPADLVVFDPDRLADRATFKDPLLPPDGIEWVIVNGLIAVEEGAIIEPPKGEFLLRGCKPEER